MFWHTGGNCWRTFAESRAAVQVLQAARRAKNLSVTRCGQLVGTSRRRYLGLDGARRSLESQNSRC